jgi:hypothetical protein
MSLIINLEIWFAQSLRVSRIWIKEIPIRKNKLWKNLEAPDSYGKSSSTFTFMTVMPAMWLLRSK